MMGTKAVVKEILAKSSEQKTPKKLRSVKAQKTAAKVQLMKLKMKSLGDKSLPQEERVYFLVRIRRNIKVYYVYVIQISVRTRNSI